MRYDVNPDGTIANGRVFFDITRIVPGDDAWDGIKVDQRGNVYAAGPAGIYVLSPAGEAPRHDHPARARGQLRLG